MNELTTITQDQGAVHFSKLYQVICTTYGKEFNNDYTYQVACDHLIRVLQAYEHANPMQSQFNLIGHDANGVQEWLLTYQMTMVYVSGLDNPNHVQTLTTQLNYAYNPQQFQQIVAALPVVDQPSNILVQESGSPIFTDGRTGMSSLRIIEIASAAKGKEVRHDNVLAKARKLDSLNLRSPNSTYEVVESKYINTQNKEQRFYWLSYDFALLIAGTYSPDVQVAVIDEMNRLRAIVNTVPYLPKQPMLDIEQPRIIELPSQYYTIQQAIEQFGDKGYAEQQLETTSSAHGTPHYVVHDGTIAVPAYHVYVWQCSYDILPQDWLVQPTNTVNVIPNIIE